MRGSWRLGKLAGIDVQIHWTFLLLPAWIYVSSLAAGSGGLAATLAVVFVLAIFGCVVLHELGHSLTARQFGIATRDITLLPIGGVARLERMPRSPWQELAIAVAGPAVNVVIAILLFSILPIAVSANQFPAAVISFLSSLAWVNVGLVVFNMLPAFPMDGGRVLRALLAMRSTYEQATRVATGVGKFVAVLLGLLGLFSGNLMLVFVAGFVFLAARGEASLVAAGSRQSATGEWQPIADSLDEVRERTFANLPVVSAQWNAANALGRLASESFDEFIVSNQGTNIGIVRLHDLRAVVAAGWGMIAIERLLAGHMLPFRKLGY